MPQGKLLRALQERVIERVGGSRTIPADVRVIAASNVDLAEEVRAGRFRQDLYYRLCVFPIAIPPLRERRDDIPLLVDHFLRRFCELHRRDAVGLTRRAMDALLAYDFPGNIRELQNLIERGVIFADPGGWIDTPHLFTAGESIQAFQPSLTPDGRLSLMSANVGATPAALRTAEDLTAAEAQLYRKALEEHGGNVSAAARALGLPRARFEYRLKKHGLLK
jgi:transcriptional regulator with GAF, ATPase, and Fis domain